MNREIVRRIEEVLSEQPIVGRPMIPFSEAELRVILSALSTEADALQKAVIDAARDLSNSLNGGFVRCENCGDQEDTTDLDFAPQLRKSLDRLDVNKSEDK